MAEIRSISLRKMAGSIAANNGDQGAIIISVGKDGTRIGVEGLTPQQVQDALALAIHYNFCLAGEATASPCPTFPG